MEQAQTAAAPAGKKPAKFKADSGRRLRYIECCKSSLQRMYNTAAKEGWHSRDCHAARDKILKGDRVHTHEDCWDRLTYADQYHLLGYAEALHERVQNQCVFLYLVDGRWYTPIEGLAAGLHEKMMADTGHFCHRVETNFGSAEAALTKTEYKVWF